MKKYNFNCKNCSQKFLTRKRERRYCSRRCKELSPDGHNRKKARKACVRCGSAVKSAGCGAKFCSPKCSQLYRSELASSIIAAGGKAGSAGKLKQYLIGKYGELCSKCGWADRNPITGNCPIEIDHIDGDNTNHTEVNGRLLCPNCHSLTPTYRFLNRKKH